MFRPRFLMAAFVAAIAALAGPSTSRAAFTVTIESGGSGPLTITDNQTVGTVVSGGYIDTDTSSTNPNEIDVKSSQGGALNGFTFSIAGLSNSPGNIVLNQGVVSSSVITLTNGNSTAGRFSISIFSDGFTIPGAGQLYLSTIVASVTGLSIADFGALLTQSEVYSTASSATTVSTNSNGYYSIGGGFPIQSGPVAFTSNGTYSNELVVDLYVPGSATVKLQIDSVVSAPAPAGLILAATGLPFFGLLRRRLRRPETTTAA